PPSRVDPGGGSSGGKLRPSIPSDNCRSSERASAGIDSSLVPRYGHRPPTRVARRVTRANGDGSGADIERDRGRGPIVCAGGGPRSAVGAQPGDSSNADVV